MPKDQMKKFELGVIEVGTVVLDVSPPAATYTSAKTVYWNSSGIQWKFHSTPLKIHWSGADLTLTPLHSIQSLLWLLSKQLTYSPSTAQPFITSP
jgi:hypothetical protein